MSDLPFSNNISTIFEAARDYIRPRIPSNKRALSSTYCPLLRAHLHMEPGHKIQNLRTSTNPDDFLDTTGLVKGRDITWGGLTTGLAKEDRAAEEALGQEADITLLKKHAAIQALQKAIKHFPNTLREKFQDKAADSIQAFKKAISTHVKLQQYSYLFDFNVWADFAKHCQGQSQKLAEFFSERTLAKPLAALVEGCAAALKVE